MTYRFVTIWDLRYLHQHRIATLATKGRYLEILAEEEEMTSKNPKFKMPLLYNRYHNETNACTMFENLQNQIMSHLNFTQKISSW